MKEEQIHTQKTYTNTHTHTHTHKTYTSRCATDLMHLKQEDTINGPHPHSYPKPLVKN